MTCYCRKLQTLTSIAKEYDLCPAADKLGCVDCISHFDRDIPEPERNRLIEESARRFAK